MKRCVYELKFIKSFWEFSDTHKCSDRKCSKLCPRQKQLSFSVCSKDYVVICALAIL